MLQSPPPMPTTVPARKTELAHQALARHGTTLGLRQRRALILCDGRRSTAELSRMLGADTSALLQQLCDDGYLEGLDTTLAVAARKRPAAVAPGTGSPPAAARRRSLSAARIYVQGILELQRAPAAQMLRTRLVGATSEPATIAALLEAVAGLADFTKPGFAERIRERVAKVLPEPHLPALAALALGDNDDAPA